MPSALLAATATLESYRDSMTVSCVASGKFMSPVAISSHHWPIVDGVTFVFPQVSLLG